jgi:hypothetical protein
MYMLSMIRNKKDTNRYNLRSFIKFFPLRLISALGQASLGWDPINAFETPAYVAGLSIVHKLRLLSHLKSIAVLQHMGHTMSTLGSGENRYIYVSEASTRETMMMMTKILLRR